MRAIFLGAEVFLEPSRYLIWSLLVILLMGGCTPTISQPIHPCNQFPPTEKPALLLREAKEHLQAYLPTQEMTATIQVKEEGSFMLGAYPGERALWSIQVSAPTLALEDTATLNDLALAAYCLRPGWVWLNITLPSGDTTMVSYSQTDLEKLYQKKGNP